MSFVSKLSPEQWAEARRLRAAGDSLAAVARHFGLKAETVRTRARREGWPSPASGGAFPAARRAKARRASPATADIHAEVARRLFGMIAVRSKMMELSMQKRLEAHEKNAGTELPVVTQDERDAFAALIEDIKQVMEITPEPAATADGRRRTANPELTALSDDIDPHGLAVASEKDALRAELAERLGKMFPQS